MVWWTLYGAILRHFSVSFSTDLKATELQKHERSNDSIIGTIVIQRPKAQVQKQIFLYTLGTIRLCTYLFFSTKVLSTSPRLENFSNNGFGNNQRNRWDKPFSAFPGISIKDRATPGCVKPPTVRWVDFITKLASPHTIKKKRVCYGCVN